MSDPAIEIAVIEKIVEENTTDCGDFAETARG
jgi:hypothetical protein